MIHFTEEPTLKDYLAACRRRAWIIAAVMGTALLCGIQFLLWSTPLYRAQATVFVDTSTWNTRDYVERAEVPEVARVVEMLATQVLSNEALAAIAHERGMFKEVGNDPGKLAGAMRKSVSTEVIGFDQFQVRFVHPDPHTAAAVANQIAESFVAEQKKVRREHGEKTEAVMTHEVNTMSALLAQKDEQIKQYRIANQGSLPGQTEGSLRAIERWQGDLVVNASALRRANERLSLAMASTPEIFRGDPIEALKAEIAGLQAERAMTKALIRAAETKVARAAEVEGTLAGMQRTYNSTLEGYNDLLERQAIAVMRAELDQSRFDTLFQVVEAAKAPNAPFQPARALVMLGALAFGLLGGAGLAVAADWFDDTFHDAPALGQVTGLPVIAVLPRQRRLLSK